MTFTISRKVLVILGSALALVVAGVLGALIAGGAGGKTTTTTTVVETVEFEGNETGAEESTEEEGEIEEAAGEETATGDCDELGINREVGKEGTCTEEGTTLKVVNKTSTLKLEELEVKLLNMETTKTVSSEYGETKSANGTYVIFELEVTNKLHAPVYFDSSQEQTVLWLGDNEYTEDFEVENYAMDNSFVDQFEEIQPDTTSAGAIAFDVPEKLLPDLKKSGNLGVWNFSDEGSGAPDPIGIIRTYQ